MNNKVLVLGPYILHPTIDKDTVNNLFPDLVGAINEYGGDSYFLMSGKCIHLSDEVKKYFGEDHVIPVDASLGNGFSRIWYILKAIKFMKENEGAVITNLIGAISYGFEAALVGKIAHRRSVVRASGNEIESRKCAGRYLGISGKIVLLVDKIRELLAFNMASCAIVMSLGEMRRVRRLCSSSKVKVCARGVDLKRYFINRQKSFDDKKVRIVFVGRNSPEKGADIFMEVARILSKDPRFEFRIVGNFPVRTVDNLKIVGYIDASEIPAMYRENDILLMTSRTEGLPQVMIQAMASGVVPIVPRHLLSDYIVHGQNGLLISLDAKEIADTLMALYMDPTLLENMRIAAREWVEKNFDSLLCRQTYAENVLGISRKSE